MTSSLDRFLDALSDEVHQALKLWHKDNAEGSPLDDLYLFHQARRRGLSLRQASNQLLREALEALQAKDATGAELLRRRFLDGQTARTVANELNIGESTLYPLQRQALERLAELLYAREVALRSERQGRLAERLAPPSYQGLVGVADALEGLAERLVGSGPSWVIALEGIGGIGKTSLADALLRQLVGQGYFADFAWVSAQQRLFHLGGSIQPIESPILTVEALIDQLARQLLGAVRPAAFDELVLALQQRLRGAAHLIVIDNLETLSDIAPLLPIVRRLVDPSKVLLTSRESLYAEPDIFHYVISELSWPHALQLVRQEAQLRNIAHLAQANDEALHPL